MTKMQEKKKNSSHPMSSTSTLILVLLPHGPGGKSRHIDLLL